MATIKDYYQILGVDEKATEQEIREAFRRAARKYHPDVNKSKDAEEAFKRINEAYGVLSDPEKRAQYDALRRGAAFAEARRQGPGYRRVDHDFNDLFRNRGGPEFDLDDLGSLFGDLFGRFRRDGGRGAAETAVPEEKVSLTLEQVMTGTTVHLTLTEMEPCPRCRGAGGNCPACSGSGRVPRAQGFDVTIPPGVRDGTVLRVGPHARLRVEVLPHPRFTRKGSDLVGKVKLPVPTAALGGEVDVRPLVGEPVKLKVPPHTNQGKVLRLRGLGLPDPKGGARGDLLLEVELFLPEPLTIADERLYRELARHHGGAQGGEIHAP